MTASDTPALVQEAALALVEPLLHACWIAGYRVVKIAPPMNVDGERTILIVGHYATVVGEPLGLHYFLLRHPSAYEDPALWRPCPALWSIIERHIGRVMRTGERVPDHHPCSHSVRAYTDRHLVAGNYYWDGT